MLLFSVKPPPTMLFREHLLRVTIILRSVYFCVKTSSQAFWKQCMGSNPVLCGRGLLPLEEAALTTWALFGAGSGRRCSFRRLLTPLPCCPSRNTRNVFRLFCYNSLRRKANSFTSGVSYFQRCVSADFSIFRKRANGERSQIWKKFMAF